MPGKNEPIRASDSFRIVGFTTLIRNPLGSSIAVARTKPSNAPETVAPATPAKIGSSLRTPETKVNDPFSLMKRDCLLNQINLTHELASQRELPLFSGEFRKRSKCDFTCCNGHGIKRADGLIKLPDTFAVLDLDAEIARFASDLDYLMASTRQCLLNQFADLSICAN